ncbi:DinB family protein [Catalinimonas sp. 4WD22]|uniref:DinB family protein n=1 Tax=Catalinimonas locisalis TaxID=3133978 RepID=UPI003101AD4B
MKRRSILSLIGVSPFALIPSRDAEKNVLINDLKVRWAKSKEYTLAVFDAMPAEHIEFSPTENQLTFAQHFIHLSFFNVLFMGLMTDKEEFTDFESLMQKDYLIPPPDDIDIFKVGHLKKQSDDLNKKRVTDYITETFDDVIATLSQIDDEVLYQGKEKPKPGFLAGHTNLDLILRGENHTAHHRAQAIVYLRLMNVEPPGYGQYNIL